MSGNLGASISEKWGPGLIRLGSQLLPESEEFYDFNDDKCPFKINQVVFIKCDIKHKPCVFRNILIMPESFEKKSTFVQSIFFAYCHFYVSSFFFLSMIRSVCFSLFQNCANQIHVVCALRWTANFLHCPPSSPYTPPQPSGTGIHHLCIEKHNISQKCLLPSSIDSSSSVSLAFHLGSSSVTWDSR